MCRVEKSSDETIGEHAMSNKSFVITTFLVSFSIVFVIAAVVVVYPVDVNINIVDVFADAVVDVINVIDVIAILSLLPFLAKTQ